MEVAKLIGDTELKLVRRFVRLHESIKERWVQPVCPLSEPFQNGTPLPDVSFWGGFLLLNGKAKESLLPLIAKDGELLPLIIDGVHYDFFNCMSAGKEQTALCLKKYMDGFECGLETLVFDEGSLQGLNIFKSELEGYKALFVSEAFKKCCEKHHLTGVRFDEDLLNIF
ncbi:imm11 family protein [Rheinheimera gaetbuli]